MPVDGCSGLSFGLFLDGPVPRLVGYPKPIFTRIGHGEAEAMRVSDEPGECSGGFEFLGKGRTAWRREVDGSARVVLTVARRRVHLQDDLERVTSSDLPLENLPLILQTPER